MSETAEQSKSPLDDVMIAMDVVDTLRHDRKLVERELNDEERRDALIERLRDIYRGQGIDVPDHILEEGVQALEEDRFTYNAPGEDEWSTWLAKLYVTRSQWGRYVVGIAGALLAYWLISYLFFDLPKQRQIAAEKFEIESRLPASMRKLAADIQSEAKAEDVKGRVAKLLRTGLNAANSNDLDTARKSEAALQDLLQQSRDEYEIRIVNRKGQVSGLWRVPKINPDALNFYLVVEAVAPSGVVLPQLIENEETGKKERVKVWAVRVEKQVLDAVRRDKQDDGIIQNNVAGKKLRGALEPHWEYSGRRGRDNEMELI